MQLLITGGTGVHGQALRPLAEAAGHQIAMPGRDELDLFDRSAGTWYDKPMRDFGATLHISDAGRALLSALSLPSGTYNVCRDGERVSAERFAHAAGWQPRP
jgi:hypothetical protein